MLIHRGLVSPIRSVARLAGSRAALAALLCGVTWTATSNAQTTPIVARIDVGPAGLQGNNTSFFPHISDDGRYVVFSSYSTNIVPGDTNIASDIFVRDLHLGTTTRVDVSSLGAQSQAHEDSYLPDISGDGRYVVFESLASNLVPGDTNGVLDIFVRDMQTGQLTRVSVDSSGAQSNDHSFLPMISDDGRWVTFQSQATNLVPGDTNGVIDIFLHDLQTGATTRVSVDSAGVQANGACGNESISGDGRLVAFESTATNLVPGDTNGVFDCFLHDNLTGATTRVSVDSTGAQGDADSNFPYVSKSGKLLAFVSLADNLVPNDANTVRDQFLRDLTTGQVTMISVDSAGNHGDGECLHSAISEDDQWVAFDSAATNLVPGDTNGWSDVFLHNLATGATTRISTSTGGAQADFLVVNPAISADARYVVFMTGADNLVTGDTNNAEDIFVHETSPWTNLHGALPGTLGNPLLAGTGSLLGGDVDTLGLSDAAPNALAALFVSFTSAPVPVKGGILQAFPIGLQFVLATSGAGSLSLPVTPPPGLPSDLSFVVPVPGQGRGRRARLGVLERAEGVRPVGEERESSGMNNHPPTSANHPDRLFHPMLSQPPVVLRPSRKLIVRIHPGLVSSIRSLSRRCGPRVALAATLVAAFAATAAPAWCQAAYTTRIDHGPSGVQSNLASWSPTISGDGRYVVYMSWAYNLAGLDTNFNSDIYLYDVHAATTVRVSVDSSGAEANGNSDSPDISADGNIVVFDSTATNLVAGDTNGAADVFVRNLAAGTTTRISVNSSGEQTTGFNPYSFRPRISRNGQYVVFESNATNLVAGDNNGQRDIFVRDLLAGTTTRVNVDSSGVESNAFSQMASISADGRYVVFESTASNLVPGDTNGTSDVFVHDNLTGVTSRASVGALGEQGNGDSLISTISPSGKLVGFSSNATNLVANDTNGDYDVFVRDLLAGTTTRVSTSSSGAQAIYANVDPGSFDPAISGDDRYVAFDSGATNLVPGDTNPWPDVFVKDLQTQATTRESVSTTGGQGSLPSQSSLPSISDDGRLVVFYAYADLVPNDSNGVTDIYLREKSPWTDLGGALAGVSGSPVLKGTGTLLAGDADSLNLTNCGGQRRLGAVHLVRVDADRDQGRDPAGVPDRAADRAADQRVRGRRAALPDFRRAAAGPEALVPVPDRRPPPPCTASRSRTPSRRSSSEHLTRASTASPRV